MIHFFRRIRQGLINQDRIGKYLLYAAGEILLVVIGILIALQVNNWNEHRKELKLERKVLAELLESLERNHQMLLRDSINRTHWNRSSEVIIRALEEGYEYHDTLDNHFQFARIPGTMISLSNAGYENLKNIGLNVIASDSLKKRIINLFEISQSDLMERMQYFELFQPARAVAIDELFSYNVDKFNPSDPVNVPIHPRDYKTLNDHKTYLSMIKSVLVQRKVIGVLANSYKKENLELIALIKKELGYN